MDRQGIKRGACKCGDCVEYSRPEKGNSCDYCGCMPTKHQNLSGSAVKSTSKPIAVIDLSTQDGEQAEIKVEPTEEGIPYSRATVGRKGQTPDVTGEVGISHASKPEAATKHSKHDTKQTQIKDGPIATDERNPYSRATVGRKGQTSDIPVEVGFPHTSKPKVSITPLKHDANQPLIKVEPTEEKILYNTATVGRMGQTSDIPGEVSHASIPKARHSKHGTIQPLIKAESTEGPGEAERKGNIHAEQTYKRVVTDVVSSSRNEMSLEREQDSVSKEGPTKKKLKVDKSHSNIHIVGSIVSKKIEPCKLLQTTHVPFTEINTKLDKNIKGVYKIAYRGVTVYVGQAPKCILTVMRKKFTRSGQPDLFEFLIRLSEEDLKYLTVYWLNEDVYKHECKRSSYLKCVTRIQEGKPLYNVVRSSTKVHATPEKESIKSEVKEEKAHPGTSPHQQQIVLDLTVGSDDSVAMSPHKETQQTQQTQQVTIQRERPLMAPTTNAENTTGEGISPRSSEFITSQHDRRHFP